MAGESATTAEIMAELKRCHEIHAGGTLPDARALQRLIQAGDVNAPCAETGLTPLLWAVEHDSLYVSFLMANGADPGATGTGDHAVAPAERAVAKGLMQRADQIARHGGPQPPALVAWREAARERIRKYDGELKAIVKRLEAGIKAPEFLAEAERMGAALGVAAKKMPGRKGHLSFKGVGVKKLAKAAGLAEEGWLAGLQAAAAAAGASLVTAMPLGETAKDELFLVPSRAKREVVAVSRLLSDEGTSPLYKLEVADQLDAIDAEHPFDLLSTGPYGVLGRLQAVPDEPQAFARHLLEICGELVTDWQIRLDGERGNTSHIAPGIDEIVPRLAAEIAEDRVFWLPWGVDH